MLVGVFTCQNATLLEITCHGSIIILTLGVCCIGDGELPIFNFLSASATI